MLLTAVRINEPGNVSASITFDAADLNAAFENQLDPDEQLYFALFSDAWHTKTASEQLMLLARVAAIAEQAVALNPSAGIAEPK